MFCHNVLHFQANNEYIYIYIYIQSTHDGSATFHTFDVCADMYVRWMCDVCAGCMHDVCAGCMCGMYVPDVCAGSGDQ